MEIKRYSEKIDCHCGSKITRSNYSTHLKSKIHLKNIRILQEINSINKELNEKVRIIDKDDIYKEISDDEN